MLLNILASCAVIALFLVSSTNAKSGYWTADDLSAIKTRAEHFASKSTSSQEIFHALQLLNHLSSSDKKSYCDNIVKSGKSASSAYDLFFAVKSNEVAGCSFAPSSASQLIQSSLNVSRFNNFDFMFWLFKLFFFREKASQKLLVDCSLVTNLILCLNPTKKRQLLSSKIF